MRLILTVLFAWFVSCLGAQTRLAQISHVPQIDEIARSSGLIFSGTVLQVENLSSPLMGGGITQITFKVDTAIRGVQRGQIIHVREWGGLWANGERYEKGEHLFMFLYPQSKLGLTSPVAGQSGRYRVNTAGQVLFTIPAQGTRPMPLKTFSSKIRRMSEE